MITARTLGRLGSVAPTLVWLVAGCAVWRSVWGPSGTASTPESGSHRAKHAAAETVTVRVKDPSAEQRAARLELRALEDEARIEQLEMQLAEARQAVVHAMAQLQTTSTRAEAASGMAEAEIALDSLKAAAADHAPPEIAQAATLLQMSSAEFDKQNYGGALYLATQAKSLTRAGRDLLIGEKQGSLRPGEVVFAVPLKVATVTSASVRAGPGNSFGVVTTVDRGTPLVAYSHVDVWVRVSDEARGKSGWVPYDALSPRDDGP